MKIKIKPFKMLLFLGMSLVMGCKKDKTGPENESVGILPVVHEQEKKFLPVQIGTNDPKTLFSYTPDHSLSKIVYKDGKSTVLSYNLNGKPVAFMRYQGSKLISSTEYQLDQNGLIIEGDQFALSGNKLKAFRYYKPTYNASGQLTAISYYDNDDNLTGTEQKEYDTAGNLVLEKSSSAQQALSYSYDDRKGIFKNVNYAWLFAVEKESGFFLSVTHNIRACNNSQNPADNQSFSYIYNTDQYPETISSAVQGKTTNDKVVYKQIE